MKTPLRFVIVLLSTVLAASAAIADQKAPTVDENFAHYCQQGDASTWFCVNRQMAIPTSQKWDIVGGYCLDRLATARPEDETLARALIKALKDDPKQTGRAAVCDEYALVPVPMALVYDHRLGRWSDKNAIFETRKRFVEIDPALSIPIAHLAKYDRVGIIIKGTNPMLFVANRGEVKEENIDQIKGLEQLLALLGPAVAKTASDANSAANVAKANVSDMRTVLQKATPAWTAADRVKLLRGAPATARSLDNAALASLANTALVPDRTVFTSDLEKIKQWTDATNAALSPVKTRLQDLVTQRSMLQFAAQRLERGPAQLERALDVTLEDPSAWRAIFKKLADDSVAVKPLAGCVAIFNTFVDVVSAKSEDPVAVVTAATRLLQFYDDGSQKPNPAVCAELEYDGRLVDTTQKVLEAAKPAVRDPANSALIAALRDVQADSRDRQLEPVLVLQRLIAELDANRQGIKEAVAKEEETRKASLSLGLMGARARDAGVRVDAGHLVLTDRIYVMDEVYSASAAKVRTTPLKITLNSQNSDSVPTDLPKEVATSYRFVRRGLDRLSFGVGMLAYTPASSVTYTAVDPDPSTNQATTTTTVTTLPSGATQQTVVSQPELKAIREKERQPRSGSYALFLNGRASGGPDLGVGGQFGVATSSDNPAFLFGASFNITKFISVGLGKGKFRVKELAADQTDSAVRVLSADDIRFDTHWIWATYASISINISGLPLFK